MLVSLAAVRPWRRCFSATGKMAVRCAPDDRALKRESSSVSFGAVEAGALMESIDGACCSEPPTSSPTTRIAVLVDDLGKIIALTQSVVPNSTWRARLSPGILC